jgi:DNA-binding response OmpR family regulator
MMPDADTLRSPLAAAEKRVLLLAEDAPARADLAADLRRQNFRVTSAEPTLSPAKLAAALDHDLTVLDTELGAGSYERVLAAIAQAVPGHPVFLLAPRAGVSDRVRGLDAGAADVIVRPFSVRELAARIRARVRFDRRENIRLRHGDLEVDMAHRHVRHRGIPVHLSNREFDLLVYFLRHTGEVRTRADIFRDVWVDDQALHSNAVDVYVGYLRRKLTQQGFAFPLTTVRGAGYRLEAADASNALGLAVSQSPPAP